MVIMLMSTSTVMVLFRMFVSMCFRMSSALIFKPELGHCVSDHAS
jgi:hypothetical protein